MTSAPFRQRFLKIALELMGTPYRWAGKDTTGIDCSGLVTVSLFLASNGRLDWRHSHNTDLLWRDLAPAIEPRAGDLAFYGGIPADPNDVSHVMLILTEGMVFGAAGGDHTTTTAELARAAGARVKVKTDINYRPDFRGLRALPTPP